MAVYYDELTTGFPGTIPMTHSLLGFRGWLSLLLLVPSLGLGAEDTPASASPPDVIQSVDENIEPDVRIIESERGTVQEYRAEGKVYMVKISPKNGPPYYLLDTDGDGVLDVRYNDVRNIAVPQWILYSW